ncbi:hypothetical protein JB92DRAFT_2901346 [Gautieria morchelliformis]|nr:hypothetical protein JB92DRAFT_2901346 [Gautieria morchelliformis]
MGTSELPPCPQGPASYYLQAEAHGTTQVRVSPIDFMTDPPQGARAHGRPVLNYKRIPYKTVWLSYPDIESTLTKLGCAAIATKPEDPTKSHYTLPAIVDTGSSPPAVIIGSLAVAEYLDTKYPARPVFPKQGTAPQYTFEACFKSLVITRFRRCSRLWISIYCCGGMPLLVPQ